VERLGQCIHRLTIVGSIADSPPECSVGLCRCSMHMEEDRKFGHGSVSSGGDQFVDLTVSSHEFESESEGSEHAYVFIILSNRK
jgi:hypothetical protein